MKKAALCLLISFGITFLLVSLANKPFYQILDQKLYDLQMNLRQPPAQDPRILFGEMDDAAIEQLGRWPWPRNVFANITNTLNALGARQIIFDVTFTQPNQVFRLKGQGLRKPTNACGDLLVTVTIEIPHTLTWKQEQLLKEYAELEKRSTIRRGN